MGYGDWYEMRTLGKPIDDHPDRGVPFKGFWQRSHEIHSDVLPLPLGYLQRL